MKHPDLAYVAAELIVGALLILLVLAVDSYKDLHTRKPPFPPRDQ
jgi:hypothetical protein